MRNLIAHPKPMHGGNNVIVSRKGGSLVFDTNGTTSLREGDTLYMGYGDILKEFRTEKAFEVVGRAYKALEELRKRTNYEGLPWLHTIEEQYPWIAK